MDARASPWPPVAGFLLAAMLLAAFVFDMIILVTQGKPPVMDPDAMGAELLRVQSDAWLGQTWLYTLLSVPAALFLIGVHRAFQGGPGRQDAQIGVTLLAVFWAIHLAHNVLLTAVIDGLAPGYTPGSPDAAAVEASAGSFVLLGAVLNPFVGIGLPFLALGSLFLARAGRAAGTLAPWTTRVAVAMTALVGLGILQIWFLPLVVLSLIGWILHMAWITGVSVHVLYQRVHQKQTASVASPPA